MLTGARGIMILDSVGKCTCAAAPRPDEASTAIVGELEVATVDAEVLSRMLSNCPGWFNSDRCGRDHNKRRPATAHGQAPLSSKKGQVRIIGTSVAASTPVLAPERLPTRHAGVVFLAGLLRQGLESTTISAERPPIRGHGGHCRSHTTADHAVPVTR
jgi:hypothetical protein